MPHLRGRLPGPARPAELTLPGPAAETVDAVVVGAGHNGLVAATLLADAGWSVLVLEANDVPGGAVRSAELTVPGFRHDVFSAFYPLAVASPVFRDLDLASHGLRWRHAPAVLGHPLSEGRAAVLHRDPARTAASLAEFAPADGPAWLRLCAEWDELGDAVAEALLRPFPPVRAGARLLARARAAGGVRLARRAVTPLREWAGAEFAGDGAPALLAGSAMHTDLGPTDVGSSIFGWLLCMLGQHHGFPVPAGGAGMLTEALVSRLTAAGGDLRLRSPVQEVVVRDGAALGVRVAGSGVVRARRAVLADVAAPLLYRELIDPAQLPGRIDAALRGFRWDLSAVKVDWALTAPIPWRVAALADAGTLHLGGDLGQLSRTFADLDAGRVPAGGYAVLGQMSTADPGRSPAGTETAWAYAHLPRGRHADTAACETTVQWIERTVERAAPGFGDLVAGRSVLGPAELAAANRNLVQGTMNGGTSAVHQQLFLRPMPGLGRADTPVRRLFLAGSSAHPGGGVHGACGANAARAALAANGPAGALYRGLVGQVTQAIGGS